MGYRLTLSASAKRDLKKLDPYVQKKIAQWLDQYLDGCTDPRIHGHVLHGELSDYWTYRIGNYRVIAEIKDRELEIYAIKIADRKYAY